MFFSKFKIISLGNASDEMFVGVLLSTTFEAKKKHAIPKYCSESRLIWEDLAKYRSK